MEKQKLKRDIVALVLRVILVFLPVPQNVDGEPISERICNAWAEMCCQSNVRNETCPRSKEQGSRTVAIRPAVETRSHIAHYFIIS